MNEMMIESRTRELGLEIFERAREHQPRFWRRAWWEKKLLDYVSDDPMLQSRAFRFIEALPYMHDDADVARHMYEYLSPVADRLPGPSRLVLAFDNPASLWGRCMGATARRAAFVMARSFITGVNTTEAIANAVKLRSKNMAFTLDVLGEATHSEAQADRAANVYLDLIESLGRAANQWPPAPLIDNSRHGSMPRSNISIKLTALAPTFDPKIPDRSANAVWSRLGPLLTRARELNVFVNIDMEQFKYRDMTLDMFERFSGEADFRDWPHLGIVVQAYLRDSDRDLARLIEFARQRGTGFAIRLVKGAYWDSETTGAIQNGTPIPVWTRKWESDAAFERLTRTMLEHADLIRPAFASHNVRSLAHAMAAAESLGLTERDYELQMLSGMGDPLKAAVVDMNRCVRIYCPYGNLIQGMAYLIRRLLENTSNDSFLKQGFDDRRSYERLLANPAQARPPSAAPPVKQFDHTFEEFAMHDFTNAVNTGFASSANRDRLTRELDRARSATDRTCPLHIDGQTFGSGEWIESHNPAHPDQIIGRTARADASHVDQAVAAARRAFASWSQTPTAARSASLLRAADLLEQRRFELTAMLMLEIGKTATEADAEVTEAIDYCRYHAKLAQQLADHPRRALLPGERTIMLYDPCGVCALLGSWDFPLALVAGMASAALAAGNVCIIKPSSHAPIAASLLIDVLHQSGITSAAAQLVAGPGETIGRRLVEHTDVDVIALCGSSETATAVRREALSTGRDRFKRVVIDAGAKNAIIIDDDVDLDEAISGVLESAFAFSGQKCTACSRAIVLDRVYQSFCARIVDAVSTLPVGDPADFASVVGPVIDPGALSTIAGYIAQARQHGTVIYPRAEAQLPADGHYVAPTIVADVDPASKLAREEIFGPVLAVLRADDFDHALELANDCPYALTGGLYSRSPAHIEAARSRFRVGNLYINRRITGSQVNVQPYGGWRLSGDGARLGGPEYLLHFCRTRTISENTMRHGMAEETNQPVTTSA